jgi:Glycosyl transferase family group 2
MRDSPRAAAVTSQILRLDRPELLDVAYLEVHFDERNVVQLQGVNRLPSEGFDRRQQVYVVPGCSVLLRADALRDVGLLDEAYFAYHEDVDWCLRAHQRGWEVYYEPFSRVFHKGSRSTERFFRKPAAAVWRRDAPQLPNAEPMPFNPVRTYLGMRNTVRLLQRYAKPTHRLAFGLALARLLPLEATAAILGAESWYRLGEWSWRDVADAYLGTAAGREGGRLRRIAALPLAVAWRFPRDLVRAARSGRLGEVAETLRALRDGVLDRPLPLERLGLR